MHGDQQIHVETRVKREMAPLIKFKCICYCFQHLVIDVYICRECVLCVGITIIYMCNYINICMFLFQIFFLSKNLDFNSDQSSKLNFYLFKIYWMLLYERFCMFVTYMFLGFFQICLHYSYIIYKIIFMKHHQCRNLHFNDFLSLDFICKKKFHLYQTNFQTFIWWNFYHFEIFVFDLWLDLNYRAWTPVLWPMAPPTCRQRESSKMSLLEMQCPSQVPTEKWFSCMKR